MSKRADSEIRLRASQEPLARKRAGWERKIRHQSRVEKLRELPRVKEGRLLGSN